MTRVVFFQVRDAQTKLMRIVETAKHHFEKRDPLLIMVEDVRAQTYVDELLWKFPQASFLPHTPTDEPTTDWIAIAKAKINVNSARAAFNLCATPLAIQGPFRIIYEFEDLSSSSKKQLSSLRFDAYKQQGFIIEAS